MGMVNRRCLNCKTEFTAKSADVNRGWAKFCSKSCKAIDQTRRRGRHKPERRPLTNDEMNEHALYQATADMDYDQNWVK